MANTGVKIDVEIPRLRETPGIKSADDAMAFARDLASAGTRMGPELSAMSGAVIVVADEGIGTDPMGVYEGSHTLQVVVGALDRLRPTGLIDELAG